MAGSAPEIKSLEEIFDRKLEPLFSKFDELNVKVDEAIHSLSFLNEKYEELNNKVTKLEANNKELNDENKYLRHEFSNMTEELRILKDAQDELEQYGRRECLEVRGIPQVTGENTNAIIINLASKIGVELKEDDISVSHRIVQTRKNPRSSEFNLIPAIIVKFTQRDKRDNMYLARFKLKDLSIKDLGYTRFNDSKIYMVESLTRKRRELFKSCLQVKKDNGYRYLWTRYGKIFLRKDGDSPAIHISSVQQLERIS